MQVDLTQEELKILLYAANMYKAHIREVNIELAGLAEERKKREAKPVKSEEGCFCCLDMPQKEPKRPLAYIMDETLVTRLQEKLRKAEMQLPMAEQPQSRKYDYGKTFGSEKWKGE